MRLLSQAPGLQNQVKSSQLLIQYWLKVMRTKFARFRRKSAKSSEKRRKTAKFRLSSNFRTNVSEISLRHCLVSLRNFGVAAKLRSKCRPKFRYRAIFRKKFRWALRNVARNFVTLRHFELVFGVLYEISKCTFVIRCRVSSMSSIFESQKKYTGIVTSWLQVTPLETHDHDQPITSLGTLGNRHKCVWRALIMAC